MDSSFQLNPAPSGKIYRKRKSLKKQENNGDGTVPTIDETIRSIIITKQQEIIKKIKKDPITEFYTEVPVLPHEPLINTFQYQNRTLIKMVRNDWSYVVKRFVADTESQRQRALNEITLHVIAAENSDRIIEPRRIFENLCDDGHKYLLLVMEYCVNGTLFEKLHKIFKQNKRFKTYKIKHFVKQIAEGLLALHRLNIAHRDIKPENILIGLNEDLYLADFGFAKNVTFPDKLTTPVFSKSYTPPEIIKNVGYDQKCDIWSLGVILYIFYTGKFPFHSDKQSVENSEFLSLSDDLRRKILDGRIDWSQDFLGENVWRNEGFAKDLVQKMLTVDPDKRIDIHQVLNHEYFKDEEVLQKNNVSRSQLSEDKLVRRVSSFNLNRGHKREDSGLTEMSIKHGDELNHVNSIMESHLSRQRNGSFYGNNQDNFKLDRNWHKSQKQARKNYKQIQNNN